MPQQAKQAAGNPKLKRGGGVVLVGGKLPPASLPRRTHNKNGKEDKKWEGKQGEIRELNYGDGRSEKERKRARGKKVREKKRSRKIRKREKGGKSKKCMKTEVCTALIIFPIPPGPKKWKTREN